MRVNGLDSWRRTARRCTSRTTARVGSQGADLRTLEACSVFVLLAGGGGGVGVRLSPLLDFFSVFWRLSPLLNQVFRLWICLCFGGIQAGMLGKVIFTVGMLFQVFFFFSLLRGLQETLSVLLPYHGLDRFFQGISGTAFRAWADLTS